MPGRADCGFLNLVCPPDVPSSGTTLRKSPFDVVPHVRLARALAPLILLVILFRVPLDAPTLTAFAALVEAMARLLP